MTLPEDPRELERTAMAAYLAGRGAETVDALTRVHDAALTAGDRPRAARAAFWAAFALIDAGERARASGWIARARRVLDEEPRDCVERGYVLLPQALEHVAAGDVAGADACFVDAARIGDAFGDRDLIALARQGHGRALIMLGRAGEGVALFDEVMIAVTAGELTPPVAGLVYCSVISACLDLFDLRRAHEWTEALHAWCEAQPNLIAYRGECRTHRAGLFRVHGRWDDALGEADRVCRAAAIKAPIQGAATYEMAEIHRLRGAHADAEDAYRLAAERGRSPQPGLALLRLAQGRLDDAHATIARVLAEPARGRQRGLVLAAAAEILIAAGDLPGAAGAARDLAAMAASTGAPALQAMAAHALGACRLASGDARGALPPLRDAQTAWLDLDAPYDAARASVLLARACAQLGDADGAQLECDAARRTFRALGARDALAALDRIGASAPAGAPAGLTAREIEVLRQIARGVSNRAIAEALAISEKTVARHVSNIFLKLNVSSRAAATAYAFTHRLAP